MKFSIHLFVLTWLALVSPWAVITTQAADAGQAVVTACDIEGDPMTESTSSNNTVSNDAAGANPQVALDTGLGRIVIEVHADRAPRNAAYFLAFVNNGDYDGGSFYRAGGSVSASAKSSRIIQGGFLWNAASGEFSLEQDGAPVTTLPTFDTTDDSGIKHVYGTVSLARDILASGDGIPEFFICTGDSPVFDVDGRTEPDTRGFPAFGKVIEGMDIVDKIAAQPTDGVSKTEAVKGQILTVPVPIEQARCATGAP